MPHYAENDSEGRHSYIPVESNFGEDGHGASNVHIASLAEKKRIWWRTAIINACFIASWYVDVTVRLLNHVYASTAQVYIRNRTVSVQQVDVLARPVWVSVSALRDHLAHVCSVCLSCCPSRLFLPSFPSRAKSFNKRLWVRAFLQRLVPVGQSVSSLDSGSNCSLFEARKQFLLPLLPVSILGYQTYHSRPLLYHFTVSCQF
jgi:hypothetical protein